MIVEICVVFCCDKMVGVQDCSNSLDMIFSFPFSNVTGDFDLVHQEFFFCSCTPYH